MEKKSSEELKNETNFLLAQHTETKSLVT